MRDYFVHMHAQDGVTVSIVMHGTYDAVHQAGKALAAAMGYTFDWIEEK